MLTKTLRRFVLFLGLAACAIPQSFAQSEKLFPPQRHFFRDTALDEQLQPYLIKFGAIEKLRWDLRNEVKERAYGQFEVACKGTEYATWTFLNDLLMGTKYDSEIDAQVAKTNALENALGFVQMSVLEEFSGPQLSRTKLALDAMPKNKISEEMFYRWIGLGSAQSGFAFHHYTKEYDILSTRFLDLLCKKS